MWAGVLENSKGRWAIIPQSISSLLSPLPESLWSAPHFLFSSLVASLDEGGFLPIFSLSSPWICVTLSIPNRYNAWRHKAIPAPQLVRRAEAGMSWIAS